MNAPHVSDDTIAVLPMAPGYALTAEQSRRVTCLALALGLLRGRNVHVGTIRAVARWLYSGEDSGE